MLFGLCLMNCWPLPSFPHEAAHFIKANNICIAWQHSWKPVEAKDWTGYKRWTILTAEIRYWGVSQEPCLTPMPSLQKWLFFWTFNLTLFCAWRRPNCRFIHYFPSFWPCRVWYQVTALQANSCLQWPKGLPRRQHIHVLLLLLTISSPHIPSSQVAEYPSS